MLTTMSNTRLRSSSAGSLAIPHELCRCCRRFAKALVQIRPTMQSEEIRICPQYDRFQDLIDGAQQRCHLCVITVIGMKEQIIQKVFQQIAKKANEIAVFTYIGTNTKLWRDYTSVSLKVTDPGVFLKERGYHASLSIIGTTEPTHKCDYPEWLKRAHVSNHVAADEHYQLIQRWLNECMDEAQHPLCNFKGRLRRPTRLLDLTSYSQDVVLVKGNASDGPYAALSYCWGSVPQLMLLQTNLHQFQDRISWDDLSKVSQDAITVCRRLSIRYLWIDSLCIIQGEDGDFLLEAPRMQEVYAGSIVTVVAAFSKDTTESFLVHRNPLEWLDCNLGPSKYRNSPGHRAKASNFCVLGHPGVYHIDSRAWYLQERLLSPRSIYFGKDGIHWECRKGAACEHEPAIEKDHAKRNGVKSVYLKSQYAGMQSMQPKCRSDMPRAREFWNKVLAAYLIMELSHPEDRLIAIAGVASIFESTLGWVSTYGLWTHCIAEELLWFYVRPILREGDTAVAGPVPSWSWISANGRSINRYDPSLWTHQMDDFYSATLISWPANSGFNISLLQGPKDTRLGIRGYLVPYTETWTGYKSDHVSSSNESGSYRFHERDPDRNETDLYCLLLLCQLSSSVESNCYCNYGLVLTPVNVAERCYRRTGVIMEEHSADEFPDATASQLVKGKFLTDLWAPVGEEQEIFLV